MSILKALLNRKSEYERGAEFYTRKFHTFTLAQQQDILSDHRESYAMNYTEFDRGFRDAMDEYKGKLS